LPSVHVRAATCRCRQLPTGLPRRGSAALDLAGWRERLPGPGATSDSSSGYQFEPSSICQAFWIRATQLVDRCGMCAVRMTHPASMWNTWDPIYQPRPTKCMTGRVPHLSRCRANQRYDEAGLGRLHCRVHTLYPHDDHTQAAPGTCDVTVTGLHTDSPDHRDSPCPA
jgi:hypothetical protein